MDAASMRRRAPWVDHGKLDWGAIATWTFGFAIIAYLGLRGGGYDPLVHDQLAIVRLVDPPPSVAVGALPGESGGLGWAGLALLVAFAVWTGISLDWTESVDRTCGGSGSLDGIPRGFRLGLLAPGPRVRDCGRRGCSGDRLVAAVALLLPPPPGLVPCGRSNRPVHHRQSRTALLSAQLLERPGRAHRDRRPPGFALRLRNEIGPPSRLPRIGAADAGVDRVPDPFARGYCGCSAGAGSSSSFSPRTGYQRCSPWSSRAGEARS